VSAISDAIQELERQLKQLNIALSVLRGLETRKGAPAGRRGISEAGRQRIIEAQRRRWAKFRAAKSKAASAA
jgi:hypothetical protein